MKSVWQCLVMTRYARYTKWTILAGLFETALASGMGCMHAASAQQLLSLAMYVHAHVMQILGCQGSS